MTGPIAGQPCSGAIICMVSFLARALNTSATRPRVRRVVPAQIFGKRLGPRRVMRAVQQQRLLRKRCHFHASRPLRLAEPLPQRLVADRPTGRLQNTRGLNGGGHILLLVIAHQRYRIAFLGHGLIIRAAELLSPVLHNLPHAGRVLREHHRRATLQNTGFLGRNGLQRIPQCFRMIQTNRRNNAQRRMFDYVGRIQPPAHAGLPAPPHRRRPAQNIRKLSR